MSNQYFATVARGLEAIAAAELTALGANNVKTSFTGVHFQGDQSLLYRVNLWARTIFRVLVPIATIKCGDRQELYQQVRSLDWLAYLPPERTFAVNCTGSNRQLNHTHFTALEIKNAIVDQQRDKTGKRSNIDLSQPDLLINAHIYRNSCTLSLDSSGESLHRRGYRPAMGLAPLKETLAAALLEISSWQPGMAFLDPLCGSATLPIEAAMKALNIAPSWKRQHFALTSWPDFDADLWQNLRQTAQKGRLSHLTAPIVASEADPEILDQARFNLQACNLDRQIQLLAKELRAIEPPAATGVIITNPPYGKRIGNISALGSLYQLLGDVLKQRFRGWQAYILTGNKELARQIRLKPSRRIPVYNGSLLCSLLELEIF